MTERRICQMIALTKENSQLIEGVREMLKTHPRVVIPVKGNSMLPFIIPQKEAVELARVEAPLQVGDIILAWTKDHYVIHRIICIDGDHLTLMGDGNIKGTESCMMADVVAKAEYVVDRHGKKHYLYTPFRLWFSRLWNRLMPVRRWILAVYRRTVLRIKLL